MSGTLVSGSMAHLSAVFPLPFAQGGLRRPPPSNGPLSLRLGLVSAGLLGEEHSRRVF